MAPNSKHKAPVVEPDDGRDNILDLDDLVPVERSGVKFPPEAGGKVHYFIPPTSLGLRGSRTLLTAQKRIETINRKKTMSEKDFDILDQEITALVRLILPSAEKDEVDKLSDDRKMQTIEHFNSMWNEAADDPDPEGEEVPLPTTES